MSGRSSDKRTLQPSGMTHNVPKDQVLSDMALAADALRSQPGATIRIDVRYMNYTRLKEYLLSTGDIKA